MRHLFFRAAAVTAAALAAAACDGRGTTGPGAPLSPADAASLSRAVYALGAGLANGGIPSGVRGNQTVLANGTTTFSFNFDTSRPCSPSGSVGLAGAIAGGADAAARTAQVQLNVAVRHQACTVQADNGNTFKLTGDPRIDVSIAAAANAAGATAFHATEVGAFTWERGSGSSGRCTVDLLADLVPGTQTVRLSGSFCGFAIDQTVAAGG
jgi:hypothetical protein